MPATIAAGELRFVIRDEVAAEAAKPKPESKPKVKNAPKLVAVARELRDWWLEQANATPLISRGKYKVGRQLEEPTAPVAVRVTPARLLGAA